MRTHEVRLMHNNGIKAEIQFNKYIYHMVGINVPQFFCSKTKSVLPWRLEDLGNIYDKKFGDGYALSY